METSVMPKPAFSPRRDTVAPVPNRWFLLRLLLVAGIASTCLGVVAATAPRSHELTVTRQTPQIDGRLDDACWRAATVIDRFVKLGGRPMTGREKVTTRALLTAGSENLYIGITCEEPLIDKLVMVHRERDSDVWRDDDVEIMIAPGPPRGSDRYVQLIVNPAGALMDLFLAGSNHIEDRGYDSGAEVKTRIGGRDWTVEMRVPLARLPIESTAGPWRFEIARARRPVETYLTSLRTPVKDFHEVAAFAQLTGIEKLHLPVGLRAFSFGQFTYGRNTCTFEVVGDKTKLTAMSVEVGGKRRALFDNAVLRIMTGTMQLPYLLSPADRGKVLAVKAWNNARLLQMRTTDLDGLPDRILGPPSRSVFMFYPGSFLELTLPLHIRASAADPLRLDWRAYDANGEAVGTGMTTPAGGAARVRLYWLHRQPGRYRIDFVLSRNGRELVRLKQDIRLVANPWETFE